MNQRSSILSSRYGPNGLGYNHNRVTEEQLQLQRSPWLENATASQVNRTSSGYLQRRQSRLESTNEKCPKLVPIY